MPVWTKYIGAINILLLVGFTYLLADLFSLFVGQRLEVNPSLPPVESLTNRTAEARPAREMYRAIIDRNIFKMEPVSNISEGTMESTQEIVPSQLPPLRFKLVGTVSGGPKYSYAVIQDLGTKEEHLYRIGDPIGEDGKLVEISRNVVAVRRASGFRENLELNWFKEKKKSSRARPAKAARAVPSPIAPGQTEFVLDKREVEEVLQNLPRLLTMARVIPHLNKEGKSEGFRIVSIKPNSFYQKIGLKNGDVIQQINGIEIKDPSTFLNVFSQLKNESEITLDLVRRNKKESFTYEIR